MANKIRFGLTNVYIAKRSESEAGVVSYATPVRYAGAVSLTLNEQGTSDPSKFYADNSVYFQTAGSASGYEGTLEMANIPVWFKKEYLGYEEAANGNIVKTDALGSSFALLFQCEGDEADTRYCLYNGVASITSREFATKEDTVDPKTESFNISIVGDKVGDKQCYILEANAGDTNYANFFTACTLPTF